MALPRLQQSNVALRLDLVRPAPDPPLTAFLETVAALAANLAGLFGAPVVAPERAPQRRRRMR